MFGFEPSDEQKTLVESVRRFAGRELRLAAHDADERADLPAALLDAGAELALLPASLPEAYGGFGERSAVTGALFAEELAWGDLSGALALLAPGLVALPVLLTALASAGCAADAPADSRIDILLGEPLGTISPDIYGHFVENLSGVVYDGIWVGENSKVPNIKGIRKELVDQMKKIKPSVVRFPGGCFADSYDWRDGIGPSDRRPKRTNFWAEGEVASAPAAHRYDLQRRDDVRKTCSLGHALLRISRLRCENRKRTAQEAFLRRGSSSASSKAGICSRSSDSKTWSQSRQRM